MSVYKPHYKHKNAALSLLMVLFMIFETIFSNQGIAQQLVVKGKVRLATGEGYSPFVDNTPPDGAWSTRLIKQTFSKLNLHIAIEILPWKRALKWAQDSKFLAAFAFIWAAG